MQRIVEKNLLKVHQESISNNVIPKLFKMFVGAFFLCFIPYLHIGVFGHFVWPGKAPIDPMSCSCTCFDTVFRGHYESPPCSSYKHWYFNSTLNAYKMWCLVVLGLIVAYECFKFIVTCVMERNVRYSMVVLFGTTIFPHYYSWWNYLNYYNEQMYWQWYHQLYFTVSEFISTGFVLYLVKKSRRIETYHILVILSINLSHIIIGGVDQFITNILYNQGNKSQVVRDFGLVVPDFLAVFLVLYETVQLAKRRDETIKSLFYKEELGLSVIIITIMVVIGQNL